MKNVISKPFGKVNAKIYVWWNNSKGYKPWKPSACLVDTIRVLVYDMRLKKYFYIYFAFNTWTTVEIKNQCRCYVDILKIVKFNKGEVC